MTRHSCTALVLWYQRRACGWRYIDSRCGGVGVGDPCPGGACLQFKQVVEAYEILSCDEARARYHLYGPQHQHLMPQHQHQHQQQSALEVTLRQHFGGGRFEALVGELPNNYLLVPVRRPPPHHQQHPGFTRRIKQAARRQLSRSWLCLVGRVLGA